MTSPNESGQPGRSERPGTGDGSAEVPPWQQAAARRSPGATAAPPAPPAAPAPAPSAPPAGPTPAAPNPRVSRYVTGTAAPDLSGLAGVPPRRPEPDLPGTRAESRTERTDIAVAEAYPRELPDLSGPKPVTHPQGAPAARAAGGGRAGPDTRMRGPVRASMQIRRIDPWSTLKVSALLSGALFFVWMIAVALLYLVLGAMGVWSKLNSNVGDLLTAGNGAGGEIVSAGSVFGGAALIGLVNIVLLTAFATVGAYIYNLSTDIVGGVEVTLADLD